MSKRHEMLKNMIKEKGLFPTISFMIKYKIRENRDQQAFKEQNGDLVDLPFHSVEANREFWNSYYDWSKKGEEWTDDVKKLKGLDPQEWKSSLIEKMMLKYIKENSTILEIGPGGGRWTEFLQKLAQNLVVADITQKCLDICKERFHNVSNIEYKLIKNNLDFIDENSIDFIWSYDVFVHINPSDITTYIKEIKKILKPGGLSIIHHTGNIEDYDDIKDGWKTFMGKNEFAKLIEENEMDLIEQNLDLVHFPGDIISVFKKRGNNE